MAAATPSAGGRPELIRDKLVDVARTRALCPASIDAKSLTHSANTACREISGLQSSGQLTDNPETMLRCARKSRICGKFELEGQIVVAEPLYLSQQLRGELRR
jgi:hypothetical protein